MSKLLVQREAFTYKDKKCFSYFIAGTLRKQDVRVDVQPQDKGGYAVLDLVFGDTMSAELVVKPFAMKDAATGRTIRGNTFAVRSEEEGEVYECPIKPMRPSDKAILNMLLERASK